MSFVQFQADDSVVNNDLIVAPLWSGGVTTLDSTSLYTSSAQETGVTGDFYLNVYQAPYNNSGSEVQFSVAYGHISGSGSATFNGNIPENTPTRSIYGQFRNLIYGDENSVFNFGGNNGSSKDIYVININRARFKEGLHLGSLNLKLTKSSDSISLTDDSNDSTVTNFIAGNRVYNIVSGSNGSSYNSSSVQTDSGSFGLFFPDMGIMVLNPRALALGYSVSGGIGLTPDETPSTSYTAVHNKNNTAFYGCIQRSSPNFTLQSEETISSKFFFVYAKANQFNYTTNPSIIDTNGNIIYSSLINNPQTFITTVGLYNNSNELLAVAKLSKPLPKDFTKTLSLKVRLEF